MTTENTKKILILSGIALATILFIILFTVVIVQFCKIAPLQRQKAELQAKYEQILEDKKNTEDAIEYINGNKFIEEYARNILGYGKEGEIKFIPKA